MGWSNGEWDGDTLVVDTVGFEPGMLNGRLPHSDQLHVVERFWFDPETRQLRREYTARDPRFLTETVTGSNAMNISGVPYDAEPCEERSADCVVSVATVPGTPRDSSLPRRCRRPAVAPG